MIALEETGLDDARVRLLLQTSYAHHHSLAAAIKHWRKTYAHLHFEDSAYSRYGIRPAKYLQEHPASRRGISYKSLTPPYSKKDRRQVREGHPITSAPATFSGTTRDAITKRRMRIRRRGTRITGHFSISGLKRWVLLRDGAALLKSLTDLPAAEMDDLARVATAELSELLKHVTHDRDLTAL